MFVCVIHNHSLGRCVPVESFDDACDVIRDLFQETIGRPLTKREEEDLTGFGEIIYLKDPDGDGWWLNDCWTFSYGTLDGE